MFPKKLKIRERKPLSNRKRRSEKKKEGGLFAKVHSPWLRFVLKSSLVVIITIIAGGLLGYFLFMTYTSPHRKWAQEIDLENINNLEHPAVIYDRNGKELGRIYDENRSYVPLNEISDSMVDALVAQEDKTFWTHSGYDPVGILRAVKAAATQGGAVSQGASTITQQLARGAFDLERRTIARGGSRYERKIVEIFLAMRIEEKYSKKQIIEFYLNRIYFGRGFYGIRAAAMGYYGKEPVDLTVPEAASLAALIKNPENYNPIKNPKLNFRWRNDVIDRMYRSGYISFDEADRLKKIPMQLNPKPLRRQTNFLYNQVYRHVLNLFKSERAEEIVKGAGIRIYTTIDKEMQDTATRSLRERLASIEHMEGYKHVRFDQKEDPRFAQHRYLDGVVYALDNKSGGVLVYVGGRNYDVDNFDMIESGRAEIGTALFPFLYAAAFENGYAPSSRLIDDAMDNRLAGIGGVEGILGEWGMEVERGRYLGAVTLRQALSWSKIAAAARLGMNLGAKPFIEMLQSVGITPPKRNAQSTEANPAYYPRVYLGTEPMSLKELVIAYTSFPNGGTRPMAPFIVSKITDKNGNVLWEEPRSKVASSISSMRPHTSYRIHTILQDSLKKGSAMRVLPYLPADFKGAVKTGTNYDFGDNVLVGYNSSFTCGVWMGFLSSQSAMYDRAFSSDTCGSVLGAVFGAAARMNIPDTAIPMPDDTEAVEICKTSGQIATDFCFESSVKGGKPVYVRNTYIEYFPKGDVTLSECSVHGDALTVLHDFAGHKHISNRVLPITPILPKTAALQGDDPYQTQLTLEPIHRDGEGLDDRSQQFSAEMLRADDKDSVFESIKDVIDEARIELNTPSGLDIPVRPLNY